MNFFNGFMEGLFLVFNFGNIGIALGTLVGIIGFLISLWISIPLIAIGVGIIWALLKELADFLFKPKPSPITNGGEEGDSDKEYIHKTYGYTLKVPSKKST